MPDMTHGRGDKAVAVLNGIIHVVGGEQKHPTDLNSFAVEIVEAFNPVAKRGTQVAPSDPALPLRRGRARTPSTFLADRDP